MPRQIVFDKPYVFFDLETSAKDTKVARIVQASFTHTYAGDIGETFQFKCNPGVPIEPEATSKHGFTNQDLANEPPFSYFAPQIVNFIGERPLAGFNIKNFDLKVLSREMYAAGYKTNYHQREALDLKQVYHELQPRTLTDAYRFYTGKELKAAHQADADTLATIEVAAAMVGHHDCLPEMASEIAAKYSAGRCLDVDGCFVEDAAGNVTFSFGKYRGQNIDDVMRDNMDYFAWMSRTDFHETTKEVCRGILRGKIKGTRGADCAF